MSKHHEAKRFSIALLLVFVSRTLGGMKSLHRVSTRAALALIAVLAGCSTSDSGATCGQGTTERSGECVPDGSVICASGTVFDDASGTCIVDADGCGPDETLVDGACIVIGPGTESDSPENVDAENDPSIAGAVLPSLTVPEVGADAATLSGCITPSALTADGLPLPDADGWKFEAAGPMLLDISIAGAGGLSGAFSVSPTDADLADAAWRRVGLNLTSSNAARQVFVPKAGTYHLTAFDSRSFLSQVATGDENSCYLIQVSQLAVPEPTDLVEESQTGPLDSPVFLRVTASDGELFSPTLSLDSNAAQPALVALLDGVYHSSAVTVPGTGAASLAVGGAAEGSLLVFVVDNEYNYSLSPVTYAFDSGAVETTPITGTENEVTFTQTAGAASVLAIDANASDVVNFRFAAADGATLGVVIHDPDGYAISAPCDGSDACNSGDYWFRAGATGTYYVFVDYPSAADGTDYSLTVSTNAITPKALALDTVENISLAAASRAFFTLDTTQAAWLAFNVANLVDLSTVRLSFYAPEPAGVYDWDLGADYELKAFDGGTSGLVTNDGAVLPSYLVSLANDEPHTGTETFDFTASLRNFENLGSVSESTPSGPAEYSIGVGETRYFMVQAEVGATVTMTAVPMAAEDVRIRTLLPDESSHLEANVDAAGVTETLSFVMTAASVAFAIDEIDGMGGTVTLEVTAVEPAYTVTETSVVFADACTDGATPLASELNAMSTAIALDGFLFSFFGEQKTSMHISSNGWLTFKPDYAGDSFYYGASAEEPNDVIAPLAGIYSEMSVCVLKEEAAVTVTWFGEQSEFGTGTVTTAQFQAVIRDTGVIDFVVGPEHTYGTVLTLPMIENTDGSAAFVSDAAVVPGASMTFTPQ